MRRYLHQLDERWMTDRYSWRAQRLERLRDALDARPRGDRAPGELTFDTAVDIAVECGQLAWALGEPVRRVQAFLATAGAWVVEGVDAGATFALGQGERWVEVLLLSGSRAPRLEQAAAERTLPRERLSPATREFVAGLASLNAGDPASAIAAAGAMVGAPAPAAAAPYLAQLPEMLHAAAANDQRRFDTAARERSRVLARQFSSSVEERRHPFGMLDLRGASIAVLAARNGLRVRSDDAYLGTELIDGMSA